VKAVSGKELARALERNGWSLLRIMGSHHVYGKAGNPARISVPIHGNRPLKIGLLRHLLRMAGLTEDDLWRWRRVWRRESQGGMRMVTEEQVMEALKTVDDPELMLPLVELGLIYGVDVQGDDVAITMTLTTPACPMNQYIGGQVEEALREHVPEVKNVGVNIVWSPPWNPEMMSDDAKMELGFF